METTSDQATSPTIRTRATHKKTQARGWEVDETAIEMTFSLEYQRRQVAANDGRDILSELRVAFMQETYQEAWEEAQRRNAREGRQ
jgi:hypothetical protein